MINRFQILILSLSLLIFSNLLYAEISTAEYLVRNHGTLSIKNLSVEEVTGKSLDEVIGDVEKVEKGRGELLCTKDSLDNPSKIFVYKFKICFEIKKIKYIECKDAVYISDKKIEDFELRLNESAFEPRFVDFDFEGNGASVIHRVGRYKEKEKFILDNLKEASELTAKSNLEYVQLVDFAPESNHGKVLGKKYVGLNIVQFDRHFDVDPETGERDANLGKLVIYHEYGHQYQFAHPESFEEYVRLLYDGSDKDELQFKDEFRSCERDNKCYLRNMPIKDPYEDFADHFAQYRVNSCEFKRLAMNEPIMKARYDWLRDNVYHGKEFCSAM